MLERGTLTLGAGTAGSVPRVWPRPLKGPPPPADAAVAAAEAPAAAAPPPLAVLTGCGAGSLVGSRNQAGENQPPPLRHSHTVNIQRSKNEE